MSMARPVPLRVLILVEDEDVSRALEHVINDEGDLSIAVGFATEPPYAGQPNAVQLLVSHHEQPVTDLAPGDLVFYRSLGHVGLYVGGGMIIDASRQGEPVKKRTINIMTPYGYGRVK